MSLATLANIGGLPGMDLAITAATELAQAVQNIKVFRRQAEELGNRCTVLLLAYHDACRGLEDTPDFTAAADEITAIIEKANAKSQTWANMGRVRSLVYQSEIKEGIDSLYKDVDTCAHRFNIATHAGLHRSNREMVLMRERDAADFRENLQMVVKSVEMLKEIVSQPGVQNIAEAIQEELLQPIEIPQERENLRRGLLQICDQARILPPGNDLTGQVEKLSSRPVTSGADNDVYMGLWLGRRKVALKRYRSLSRIPSARKRFEHEVDLWRKLQHTHVCPFYGVARFEDAVYSVSSWMENGDALGYINGTSEIIDRIRLLMDVQSGLEYLHSRNVVHGDLRAVNILIDDRGRACISDFGLSKVLEDIDRGSNASSNEAEGAIRWHARELVVGQDELSASISHASDVWSFGMLCLEIMTGEHPYSHRKRSGQVVSDLIQKRLPPRPTEPEVVARGLSDSLWDIMSACWDFDPLQRPSMKELKCRMQSTSPVFVPGAVLSESPQPYGRCLPPSPSSQPESQRPPSALLTKVQTPITNTDNINHPQSPSNRRHQTQSIDGQITMPIWTSSSGDPLGGSALGLNVALVQSIPQNVTHSMASNGNSPSHLRSDPMLVGRSRKQQVQPLQSPRADAGSAAADMSHGTFLVEGASRLHSQSFLNEWEGLNSSPRTDIADLLCVDHSDDNNSGTSTSSSIPSSIGSPLRKARMPSSSSSLHPGFGTLMRFDDLDITVVVKRNPEGRLTKGTLAGLVDELLVHSQAYAEHQDYQETFLAGCLLFHQEQEPIKDIIRLLLRRYILTENNVSIQAEERIAIRHEFFGFMRKMLSSQLGSLMEVSLLDELHAFMESITSPPAFVASARELGASIGCLMEQKGRKKHRLSTTASLGTRSIRQASIEPDGLAFAMMLLEGNRYKRITPTDCILYMLDSSKSQSISSASELNNKIGQWVKRAVLRSENLSDRVDTLRFFINTALECRKLRNFSSMSAILAAVSSSTISGLKETEERLGREELILEIRDKLLAILHPGHNHQAYRALLPGSNQHCVPWLAVHLKDLKSSLQKYKGNVMEDGRKLIDFEQIRIILQRISEILQYREKQRDLDSTLINFEPLIYLEEKLSSISLDHEAELELEARSQKLRSIEEKNTLSRVQLFSSVGGFRMAAN